MEARINEEFPHLTVELIKSGGGVFEVELNGELLYSKKRTGRHAEWEEVRDAMKRALG